MLDLFIDGIAAIATPDTLALMILGVIVGIIFGSVPGLTAVTGIALFLPVTYSLGPIKGMALLMAIYIGAVSGGLIAAILINIPGTPASVATCAADRCVVVTTADASSLRDAQHTVMELDRFPSGALHLVVNRVRKKLLRQLHATIDDAIDKAGLPLLGVVPEDDALPLCMNRGVPILLADGQSAATAYRNIAKRLQGERVPLLRIR